MNFLKKIAGDLKENYRTLILAFLIAVAFWLVVSIQVIPTIEKPVDGIPLEAQLTEYMDRNNLKIVGELNENVNIRIEGKRYDISALTADDFLASVDLSTVRSAGSYTLPINVTERADSGRCSVLYIEPLSVTLVVDEIVSREFPVTGTAPDISLPEGYYLDEITASPSVITLTGSSSVLDKVKNIEARSHYSGEIYESQEMAGEIIVYGSNGAKIPADDITLSTENISVNIPIYKKKELPLVFRLINYAPNFDVNSLKYEIFPKSLIVASPDDSIDYLSELDIGAIDISEIKINQPAQITISLQSGYKNLSGNTVARIVWDISDYGKLDFTTNNINILNAPDNFDISLVTTELTFTVMGPSDDLATLTSKDFFVTVNLLGVSVVEGTQDAAVSVTIGGIGQTCWVSGSYKATINAKPIQEGEE